ncbi:MAG TPA: HAD-IA family hydrolase [Candidatus Babeliales bacterium]|nr:HAD-IA family hydrolase [Candidatus Babeliales bacterium]
MLTSNFKFKPAVVMTATAIACAGLFSLWLLANNQQYKLTNDNRYHIFCDLGGVALKSPVQSEAAKILGYKNLLRYVLSGNNPKKLQNIMFDVMDKLHGQPHQHPAQYAGRQMPAIMCQMMRGELLPNELVAQVCAGCDAHPEYFTSKTEQLLIKRSVECMLPTNICKMQYVDQDMAKLLATCRQTSNCELYVLSNWDKGSSQQLRASFPVIFNNFKAQNIIFSSQTGSMKPEATIFTYATNKYQLAPNRCILIDDQLENVLAARAAGWLAILHTDAKSTAQELAQLGVFDDQTQVTDTAISEPSIS